MRAAVSSLCLLLVVACSGGSPAARPTPAGTTTVPSSLPTAADVGVVMALDRRQSGVELYMVGRNRKAVLLETLAAPGTTTGTPSSISVSSGPKPSTCIDWQLDGEVLVHNELWCYLFGDTTGRQVADEHNPSGAVALRPDGTALAWVSSFGPNDESQELVVADWSPAGASGERRLHRADVSGTGPSIDCSTHLMTVTWAGSEHLLVGCLGINSSAQTMIAQSLSASGQSHEVVVTGQGVYDTYQVSSADDSSALALQSELCNTDCGVLAPQRAVVLDWRRGTVTSVISVAAKGRFVRSVSGGRNGIVYVTDGDNDRRVYLRLPGEAKGVLVTGLAPGTGDVTAQP